jgi:hypothetical protein
MTNVEEMTDYKIHSIRCHDIDAIKFKDIHHNTYEDIRQITIGNNIHLYCGEFLRYYQYHFLPYPRVPKMNFPCINIDIETRGVVDISIFQSATDTDDHDHDRDRDDDGYKNFRYIQNYYHDIEYPDPQLFTRSNNAYFWCQLPLGTQLIDETGQPLEPHGKNDQYVYFYYHQYVDMGKDNLLGDKVIYNILWPDQVKDSTLRFLVQMGRPNILKTDGFKNLY